MKATKSNAICICDDFILTTLYPLNHSLEGSQDEECLGIEFAKATVEATVIETTTTTTATRPNPFSTKRQGTARKATCITPALHQKAPRSYSCCPSKIKDDKPCHSIYVSPPTPRLPLSQITKCGSSASSSTRGKAILPKRRLFLPDREYSKRLRRSFVTQASVECLERMKVSAESKKGGDFIRNNAVGRVIDAAPHLDDIDSATIFRQLNILKRGGYWKHLSRNDTREVEQSRIEETPQEEIQYSLRKIENKENLPASNHPNTHVSYTSNTRWDDEDDNDEEYDEGQQNITENPYVGSAFGNSRRVRMFGGSVGFCVYAITEDGWMCGPESSLESNGNSHDEQHLLLLHLPRKVGALGRQGMCIRGMDLMRRRENGVLEPHCHYTGNTSHGNSNGSLGNPLFGRISM